MNHDGRFMIAIRILTLLHFQGQVCSGARCESSTPAMPRLSQGSSVVKAREARSRIGGDWNHGILFSIYPAW